MKRDLFQAAALAILALTACPSARALELAGRNVNSEVEALSAAITAKSAQWVAGETVFSRLTLDQQNSLLGLALAPMAAPPLPEPTEAAATILPKNFDWRDHNAVSGVRNQGQCGSCWAFSMTQALESYVKIAKKDPNDLRLSEQVLVSCGGTGTCNGGRMDATFLQTTGLPPEEDYPYTATNGSCAEAKAGWQSRAYKVGAWNSVHQDLASIKDALATYGPLPIDLLLYEDFTRYYKSGIYSYVQGAKVGWHAVLLVGYNDDGQYFIVKNSWGPDWGEGGYFRIAYSEVDSRVSLGNDVLVYLPARPGQEVASSAGKRSQEVGASAPSAMVHYGIGAMLASNPETGAVVVQGLTPGGSAKVHGLKEGDRIDAVDPSGDGKFVRVDGQDLSRAIDLIHGKQDTVLVLRVEPAAKAGTQKDITVLRTVEISMTDQIEQNIQSLRGLARAVGRMSDEDFLRNERIHKYLAKRFPKAPQTHATRPALLNTVNRTLAACEYAQALELGASYASVADITKAMKGMLASPLLEDAGEIEQWSALANDPPAPNPVDELKRQAVSHYNTGRTYELQASDSANGPGPAPETRKDETAPRAPEDILKKDEQEIDNERKQRGEDIKRLERFQDQQNGNGQ